MENITRERFDEIFENTNSKWNGDNAFQGCSILAKYTDNVITGAEHDVLYSESVDKLIEAGITIEDVTKLALLNWCIEEDTYLICFV